MEVFKRSKPNFQNYQTKISVEMFVRRLAIFTVEDKDITKKLNVLEKKYILYNCYSVWAPKV